MGNSLFSQTEVNEASGFGFQYHAGEAPVYGPINETAHGINVVIPKEVIDPFIIDMFVPSADSDTPPLFDLPDTVDARWKKLIKKYNQALSEDTELLKRTQGFLEFCHASLEQLRRTECGNAVITYLGQPGKRVSINPATAGNSVAGASEESSFPPLAHKLLLDKSSRFTEEEDGLVAKSHAVFGGVNEDASLNDMATFINSRPLYSLFCTNEYEFTNPGFLAYNRMIRGIDLRNWFTNGDESTFANVLQNGMDIAINNASTLEYIRLMTIVALESQLPLGPGNASGIRFNVKNSGLNRERPAAIGLGHELIHSYWAAQGRQLGKELNTPSTLLFEMKCVGLGPWADANISENKLRSQWQAANGEAVARRTVYELAEPDNEEGRAEMRRIARTI